MICNVFRKYEFVEMYRVLEDGKSVVSREDDMIFDIVAS